MQTESITAVLEQLDVQLEDEITVVDVAYAGKTHANHRTTKLRVLQAKEV